MSHTFLFDLQITKKIPLLEFESVKSHLNLKTHTWMKVPTLQYEFQRER